METQRYLSKNLRPLLDRIDLHIEVEPVPFDALANKQLGESSEKYANGLLQRGQLQKKHGFQVYLYCITMLKMNAKQLRSFCRLDTAGEELIKQRWISWGYR